MKKNRLYVAGAVFFVLAVVVAFCTYQITSSPYNDKEPVCIYVDEDDDVDSIKVKMHEVGASTTGFSILNMVKRYRTRTGRYEITPSTSAFNLYRKLKNGQQDPVNLVVPSVRDLDKLAGTMARNLMIDSATISKALHDEDFISALGYDKETIPALFIPNTYQVFWNISVEKLFERLKTENSRFWNEERTNKAKAINMSTTEVYTLASIVDEETANNAEKPMIAEMYLNRLAIGMPLQADPTVKKAVGDWSLRRILHEHLKVNSPYNTYINTGLTPGPLRIATIAGIDAVLNHADHNYLYMCAKEDFSGTHNFATTYSEHLKNAHKYVEALNARGIK